MRFTKFYKPKYAFDLAYMLQNVEYVAPDFLRWLWFDIRSGGLPNVVEFSFELTPKSKKVVTLARLLLGVWLLVALTLLIFGSVGLKFIGLVVLVLYPVFAAIDLGLIVYLFGSRQIKEAEQSHLENIRTKLENHPATIVAIAGSYGKSTMRDCLATVIAAGKKVATQPENLNTPTGVSRFVDTLAGDEEVIIVELGEYVPGDVRNLAQVVKPDYGIITGINEAHMMRMKSKENVIGAIFELADFVEVDRLYVNADSDWAREAANSESPTYSRKGASGWRASHLETDLGGTRFSLKKGDQEISVVSNLLGAHQVGPLSACAAVAAELGLTTKQIERGLAETEQFARRFELKDWPGGFQVIDDSYNGNKDGFEVAIDFLDQIEVAGKRIYVTPGLIELGDSAESVHEQIGQRLAESKVERIFLVQNHLTDIVAKSFKQAGGTAELTMIASQQDFIANMADFATPGDLVYLQNSQHDHFFYS